jgi:hypothetical protein
VVTRLTALKAWDTDGRLAAFARGEGGAATQTATGMFNDAVRDAVRTGGKAARVSDSVRARADTAVLFASTLQTMRAACDARMCDLFRTAQSPLIMSSSALLTEEEVEALTRSEKEPIIELPVAPATMRPALAPALSAEVWRLPLHCCACLSRWLTRCC